MRACTVPTSSAAACLPCSHGHGRGRAAAAAAYAVAACLVAAVTFLALSALDPTRTQASRFLSSSSSSSLSTFTSLQPGGGGGGAEHLLVTSSSYTDGGVRLRRNSTGKKVHEELQVQGGGDTDLLLSFADPNSGGHHDVPQLSVTPPAAAPEPAPAAFTPAPAPATVCSSATLLMPLFVSRTAKSLFRVPVNRKFRELNLVNRFLLCLASLECGCQNSLAICARVRSRRM